MVYGEDSKQNEVYDECAFGLVESVIEGYNGTMFAYGQTGCGKSHTMMGPLSSLEPNGNPDERGIIPKSIRHIFESLDSSDNRQKKFLVRCSYLEIYNEQILDLLSKDHTQNLAIKEDPNKGIYVKDLTTVIVKTVQDTEKTLFAGLK
jgi:kinesin family protein 3/17